jgi:hypothetical protein
MLPINHQLTVPLALLRNQFACFSQDPGKKKGKERQKIPTALQVVVFYNKLQDI